MKKILLSIGLSFAVTLSVQAQNITHKVVKGETLSAIAAKYGTNVGDVMRYNGMNASSKLAIGQTIKIPPTASKNKTTSVKPVQTDTRSTQVQSGKTEHIVQKSETLYGISKKYNVSVAQIKSWNNLSGDNVQLGQKLWISDPANSSSQNNLVQNEGNAVTQPTPRSSQNEQPTNESRQTEQKSIKATSVEVVPATTVSTDPSKNSTESLNVNEIPSEGYFKSDFLREANMGSGTTVNGTGMVFKTTSGWKDRKYYILMNDAPVGSIVKVQSNNRTIYAKVLWKLEEMKLNEGLNFRLSDAAAEALGINSNKFNLTIDYE